MAFPVLSSTPTVILGFYLGFLLLRCQLVTLLFLLLWCLPDHWQSRRDCLFWSPYLFLRQISVSRLVFAVVDSFLEGRFLFVHLRCPVSSFGRSHIQVTGLAQMSTLFLFFCCSIFHVSIFVHDVSLLHLTGVFSWLEDISHLIDGILLVSCHISECVSLLLLCLLYFWARNICWGLVLYLFRLF